MGTLVGGVAFPAAPKDTRHALNRLSRALRPQRVLCPQGAPLSRKRTRVWGPAGGGGRDPRPRPVTHRGTFCFYVPTTQSRPTGAGVLGGHSGVPVSSHCSRCSGLAGSLFPGTRWVQMEPSCTVKGRAAQASAAPWGLRGMCMGPNGCPFLLPRPVVTADGQIQQLRRAEVASGERGLGQLSWSPGGAGRGSSRSWEPRRHVPRSDGPRGAGRPARLPLSTRGSRSPQRRCLPSSRSEGALRSAEGGWQWTAEGPARCPLGRDWDPAGTRQTAPAGSSLGVCPAAGVLAQGNGLPGAPLVGDWARRGRMETWPR